MKKCSVCGEVKPATPEYFLKRKGSKTGIRGPCLLCKREYWKRYSENYKLNRRGKFRSSVDDKTIKEMVLETTQCVICGSIFDAKNAMHIDHCHDTKEVRGVLCRACNVGLGHFKDDPDLLEFARVYILFSRGDPEADDYIGESSDG